MYISKIEIENFRNFSKCYNRIQFGLNIIIGHNNSGKTNLIKALQLVFDRDLRGNPAIDDFNKDYVEFQRTAKNKNNSDHLPSIRIWRMIRM